MSGADPNFALRQAFESTIAVVLAAGLGKRFGSDRPKVLQLFRGRPLVHWVSDALHQSGISRVIIVIGHHGEEVEKSYDSSAVEFVWQYERLGTGHAVMQAVPLLQNHRGHILVLLGDAPCVTPQTITALLDLHVGSHAAATILSAEVDDPTGYGRIVRAADGTVDGIVEHRDADETTRSIREINSGMICFRSDALLANLPRLTNHNHQQEYYLTDLIGLLRGEGEKVMAYIAPDPREVLGVNSPEELALLERLHT
jgi:bifunctional UDP-N-acetylglucosamine pyrophosphorylase/glucosamine-1-phosphate N-acetyltransferase